MIEIFRSKIIKQIKCFKIQTHILSEFFFSCIWINLYNPFATQDNLRVEFYNCEKAQTIINDEEIVNEKKNEFIHN